jgi:zinc protease
MDGVAAAVAPGTIPRLPGELTLDRLDNGLTVALVANPQAPLVTVATCYRAGSRDEAPGHGGTAHFLEHMMFKGSARFGPGEVDRRTQALGGANNAFTTHDSTTYHFSFAADRWRTALEIESDRMAGLTLGPREVEAERRVILEEIAMYEDDPWDVLSQKVEKAFFDGHPYGRPVLGTREELLATGRDELAAFHRERYRPDTAVLVVAGDLEPERALAHVAEAFGDLPSGGPARPEVPRGVRPAGVERIERRRGEMARLMIALPAPEALAASFPEARLLATLIGSGRGSRLYRRLVDEGQLCVFAAAGLSEALDPTSLTLAAEVLPGVEPEVVEEAILALLADLVERPPEPWEVERARQVLLADWALGHERISQQALALAGELALFERGWTERTMEAMARLGPEDVFRAARELLGPAVEGRRGAVIGWSLPSGGEEP